MIDRALFLDMAGAKDSMQSLSMIANNLANATTTGFRADYQTAQADASTMGEKSTRISPHQERTYSDFRSGPLNYTGRDLDIAINGDGFIAVQTKEGKEAYTRAGNLEINSKGFLTTGRGDLVLGDGGVMPIPQAQRLSINKYGQIAAQLPGQGEKDLVTVGRIKLVDAPVDSLQKGVDGLFYRVGQTGALPDSDKVMLSPETLEGSNVNTMKSMVDLINLSRQFEIHTKLMKSVEDNAVRSNQLLDITK